MLSEWNQVGIIVDMQTSPFEYHKKGVNTDNQIEDALRSECTKFVLYGTEIGVVAERLDEILDRNTMNYHMCAVIPLEDEHISNILDDGDGDVDNVDSSQSSPSVSQKYRSRNQKVSALKLRTVDADVNDDDRNVDKDADAGEVDVDAEDFKRSTRQRAIDRHNEIEDSVDSLLRLR